MARRSNDVKGGVFHHALKERRDLTAIAEQVRVTAERVNDPLDSAVHSSKSKMVDLSSQGWAAWT
jgi:hypothetical protein